MATVAMSQFPNAASLAWLGLITILTPQTSTVEKHLENIVNPYIGVVDKKQAKNNKKLDILRQPW